MEELIPPAEFISGRPSALISPDEFLFGKSPPPPLQGGETNPAPHAGTSQRAPTQVGEEITAQEFLNPSKTQTINPNIPFTPIATTAAEELSSGVQSPVNALDQNLPFLDRAKTLFEQGYGDSVTGKALKIMAGDTEPEIKYDPQGIGERMAHMGGQVVGDLPGMVGGAIVGGANPVTAMGGTFALPAAIRQVLDDHLKKGDIHGMYDFIDRMGGAFKEALKGYITGAATGAAGVAAAPYGELSKLAAEAITMPVAGSAVEGRLPTMNDMIDSAVFLAGAKGALKVGEKITGRRETGDSETISQKDETKAGVGETGNLVTPEEFVNAAEPDARITLREEPPQPFQKTVIKTPFGDLPVGVADDDPRLTPLHEDISPGRELKREDIIASHLAEGAPVEGRKPIVYFFGGGGGSGKGAVKDRLKEGLGIPSSGIIDVDADNIKLELPEYKALYKAGDYRAAAVAHEESSILGRRIEEEARKMRSDIIVDRTMGNPEKVKQDIQKFKDAGYETRLIGVTVEPEEAVRRMFTRGGKSGRYVPANRLLSGHKRFSENFEEYAPLFDQFELYDNNVRNGELPIKIAEKGENGIAVSDEEKYTNFKDKSRINEHAKTFEEIQGEQGSSGGAVRGAGFSPDTGADGGAPPGISGWTDTGRTRPDKGTVGEVDAGADRGPDNPRAKLRSKSVRSEGDGSGTKEVEPIDKENGQEAWDRYGEANGLRRGNDSGSLEQRRLSKSPQPPLQRGSSNPSAVTTITGEKHPVTYKIVEAEALHASHDPFTFAKNPKYPHGIQEREYHSDPLAQGRVIKRAQNFEPDRVFSDDPTPTNGPSIITPDGVVLGGNNRHMIIERVYKAHGRDNAYSSGLQKAAEKFGIKITPKELSQFKRPVLVRELADVPKEPDELRALGSDLNGSESAELGTYEKAVSAGKRISENTISHIGEGLEKLGDDATLRKLFESRPTELLNLLVRDKVIKTTELPSLIDQTRDKLTDKGKDFVENALLGHVISDPATLGSMKPVIRNKIGAILPSLVKIKARGGAWDVTKDLVKAAEATSMAKAKGETVEDYFKQRGMFAEDNERVNGKSAALFEMLMDSPQKELKERFREYASIAEHDVEGQGSMFERPEPASVFQQIFSPLFNERGEVDIRKRDAYNDEVRPHIKKKLMELNRQGNELRRRLSQAGSMEERGNLKGRIKANGEDIQRYEDAQKVLRMHEVTRKAQEGRDKFDIQKAFAAARADWADRSGNIKAELRKKGALGQRVERDFVLQAGAAAKASLQIDNAGKEIYGGLSPEQSRRLSDLLESRRTAAIDRYRDDILHPGGLKGEQHENYHSVLGETTKDFKLLNERADRYFAVMRDQLRQLHENGLLTDKAYDALVSKGDYMKRKPIELLDAIDPERADEIGGETISIPDSGIKRLEGGTVGKLEKDSRMLLAEVIARTQTRILRNEANKSLYALAKSRPENGLVSIAEEIGSSVEVKQRKIDAAARWAQDRMDALTKVAEGVRGRLAQSSASAMDMGKWAIEQEKKTSAIKQWAENEKKEIEKKQFPPEFAPAPKGYSRLSVVIDGETKALYMPDEMAKEWTTQDPAINRSLANIVGWVSGTKILKATATGYNPLFALTNMPRDMARTLVVTGEYNPLLPAGLGQMAADFARVAPDLFRNRGRLTDYVNEGGGMELLTWQGRGAVSDNPVLKALQKFASYAGEKSELWTRLALRDRALANMRKAGRTDTVEMGKDATFIARDQMDFSQGGRFAKALDMGIPFLNAAIQGQRGYFKAAGKDPGLLLYKTAQLILLGAGVEELNRQWNAEAYKHISDYEKTNYYIFVLPDFLAKIDENGNKRWSYLRIAKDQEQRAITAIGQALVGIAHGEKPDFESVARAAGTAIPLNPETGLSPVLQALTGYHANKDFFRNKDLWRGPKIEPKEEYTDHTHPAWVKFGQATGLSPVRAQYAASQFVTPYNSFVEAGGYTLGKIMDSLSGKERRELSEKIVRDNPLLSRVMRYTLPVNPKEIKRAEEVNLKVDTKNYVVHRGFLDVLRGYDQNKNMEAVREFIRKAEPDRRLDLLRDFTHWRQMSNIKNFTEKSWWLDLRSSSPEARAEIYWEKYKEAEPAKQKDMQRLSLQIPGIRTERFMRDLGKLQRGGK